MRADSEHVEESIRRTYRSLELVVREGTMLVGHDGRVVESRKIDQRLGISADDLVGDWPLPDGWTMYDDGGEPLSMSDHPAMITLRTGESAERVVVYQEPESSGRARRRLRLIAWPVLDDPDVAVDLVVADHDRRRNSRLLLESQDTRFRTITDMLAVAVWEATTSGEVTYVNSRFIELTGLDTASASDLPMLDLVHPDDLVSVMEAAARASEDGQYEAQYR
ncbi:PAS domain S-box protein, partial [Ilumatobacter sp.]|uniref:PAS domain S-box protein n=1 Tax=Ilumatobacter sp. TaxID=1967498 RepID=UPI003C6BC6AD